MPHTISKQPQAQSPNSQNGGSNPYQYNANTYTIGAGIGSLNGGYVSSPPNGYGNITVNGIGAIDTLSLTPQRQIMSMQWVGDRLKTTFTGEENNQFVNLELSPERDISPYEQLSLTLLITSITSCHAPSPTALMSYVRNHHLERHFKFSAA